MSKRTLATILWFFAGWVGSGAVLAIGGMPGDLGVVFGLLLAGLIAWDPAHLFRANPASARRVRPINEVAAELDREAGAPAADPGRAAH